VTSEDKILAGFEKWLRLLAPGSPLHTLYKQMGIEMSMSLERDVRKRGSVAVHRVKASSQLDPSTPGHQTEKSFAKAMGDLSYELAIVGERLLMSTTPADLDRMIDGALAKEEGTKLALKAVQVFGAGRQGYMDEDLLGMMQQLSKMAPSAPEFAVLPAAGEEADAPDGPLP
jgi:hypothetical protein